MTQRWGVSAAALMIVAACIWPVAVNGQSSKSTSKAGPIKKSADGHPDLSGLWLYYDETPLETPGTPMRRRVGETADTAGQSDVLQRQAQQRRASERGGQQEVNPFYAEGPIRAKSVPKRASLVVDPPDGKVQVLPSAVSKQQYNTDHYSDSYLFLNPAERCITYGVPGSQFPSIDASVQILQTPENIAFVYELNGPRVVPINGGPHLPQTIRLWNGDSRARWEGNNLVIDITNYNDKGQVTHSPDRLQGIIQSTALHVVERYIPVDANTINYEVSVDDPNTFARPWKAAFSLTRADSNYKVFEYVCHEGNLRFMNIVLGGGRLKDKGANAEAEAASPSRKAAEESLKGK
jgi:hypothetical protein